MLFSSSIIPCIVGMMESASLLCQLPIRESQPYLGPLFAQKTGTITEFPPRQH